VVAPERDDIRAAKKALFEVLGAATYGQFFSYDELSNIMGLDSRTYRSLILWVGKRLEREANRALDCERGLGYRIALPNEHVDLSQRREKRGHKQLRRAVQVLSATKVSDLSPSEHRRHDAYMTVLAAQRDALRTVQDSLASVVRRVRWVNAQTDSL
jgi:hypothetical protein